MNFGVIILNQSFKIIQNYAKWIQTINIKTEDFDEDIADDVEEKFDPSNYEFNGPLPTGKKK